MDKLKYATFFADKTEDLVPETPEPDKDDDTNEENTDLKEDDD